MLLEVKEYYAEIAQEEEEEARVAALAEEEEYREMLWDQYERSIIEWSQDV